MSLENVINNRFDLTYHERVIEMHFGERETPVPFLASFPRCGNGWTRQVLFSILLQQQGVSIENAETVYVRKILPAVSCGEKVYEVDFVFPDIYHIDQTLEARRQYPSRLLPNQPDILMVKTHHIVDCRKNPCVYLFRNPRDTVLSYYCLERSQARCASVDESVEVLTKYYADYTRHFLNEAQRTPQHVKFVCLDDLIESPERTFMGIANFLSIPCSHSDIERVLGRFPFKSTYDRSVENEMSQNAKSKVEGLHPLFEECCRRIEH